MLGDIGPLERDLYKFVRGGKSSDNFWQDLGDTIRDAHAAKLKAEFWQDHDETVNLVLEPHVHCQKCGNTRQAQLDPRHKWDDPAWQAEAEKQLTE